MINRSLRLENLPRTDLEPTEKGPKTDLEGTENISRNVSIPLASESSPSLAPSVPLTQSDNLPDVINELSYTSLKRIKILKIQPLSYTLSIRKQTERFLYDEMQKLETPEMRLAFLSEYITSIQEKTYALREIELASCKVKENVLQEIDKLNLIDIKKYRKTDKESNGTDAEDYE